MSQERPSFKEVHEIAEKYPMAKEALQVLFPDYFKLDLSVAQFYRITDLLSSNEIYHLQIFERLISSDGRKIKYYALANMNGLTTASGWHANMVELLDSLSPYTVVPVPIAEAMEVLKKYSGWR